ncbi:MAG: exopolysaccharide biosynthesis polyprenyl glycosylphosphotransferase [Hyphomicrobiaceae bacterium]
MVLCLAPYLGSYAYHSIFMPFHMPPDQLMFMVGVATAGLYLILSQPSRSFTLDQLRSPSLYVPLSRWCVSFMFLTFVLFALKIGEQFSRGGMMTGFLIGVVAIVGLRLATPFAVNTALHYRMLAGRRTILLADGALHGGPLSDDLTDAGFSVEGRFRLPAGNDRSDSRIGELCQDVIAMARRRGAEEIVVVADAFRQPAIADVLERLRILPLRILLLPRTGGPSAVPRVADRDITARGLEVQAPPLTRAERLVKRALDLAGASALLIVTSPLLLLVALLVRLDSPGPVFFRQTRVGFAGRHFLIYKFRSMYTMDNGPVVKQAERGDPRVTRIGGFLRATSLDELPQLINVLLGDMSLVGPRPHALAHDQHFERLIPSYAWRHHALPGITGWAQVNGHRGETPTVAAMEARVEHDIDYIANWSIWLDIKILFMTVRAVLFSRDVY